MTGPLTARVTGTLTVDRPVGDVNFVDSLAMPWALGFQTARCQECQSVLSLEPAQLVAVRGYAAGAGPGAQLPHGPRRVGQSQRAGDLT